MPDIPNNDASIIDEIHASEEKIEMMLKEAKEKADNIINDARKKADEILEERG